MNNTDVLSDNSSIVALKNRTYNLIKRVFDILFSLIGLIALVPCIIIIKIANMLTKDFNSVFYTQDRIGKNGKIFKLYKFRSMIPNADKVLEEMLKEDNEITREYKLNKKLKDDPRISKVGKVIRKLSIDELPQVINILKGDMSLIGNRPYLPREKKDMGKYYKEIIKTRPGLTGYWQVNGRSATTFKDRLKLESYYSKHCGLKMDIKIFFKTFKVVLFKDGAE